MKISIITTSYNIEQFIEETLESVLLQRGNFELEYIVVDAKSTDRTTDIIKKHKQLVDEGFYSGRNLGIEMKVIIEPDNGCAEGYAKGVKYATGDIVGMLGADDYYLPNALSTVADIFSRFPTVDWLTGRVTVSNEHGGILYSNLPYIYKNHFIKKGVYGRKLNFIQFESCFYRKKLLDKVDFEKFKSYKMASDFYLWYIFSDYAELYMVNSTLACFRFRTSQLLSSGIKTYYEELADITGVKRLPFSYRKEIAYDEATPNVSDSFKLKSSENYISYNLQEHKWEFSKEIYDNLLYRSIKFFKQYKSEKDK